MQAAIDGPRPVHRRAAHRPRHRRRRSAGPSPADGCWSNADGEPVRILGTVLDVTDARAEAQARLSAVQRAAAIAEVAAEAAQRRPHRAAGRHHAAGRGGARRGVRRVAVFDPADGRLRLLHGRRLADAVEAEIHEEVPLDGVEIAPRRRRCPTQYAARTGERVLLPSAVEAAERFPAMQQAQRRPRHPVAGLAAAARRGARAGQLRRLWTSDHAFTDEDLGLLDGLTAQIALSVSRLQADRERAAAVAAMAEANRQLQLLADAGRVLSGTLEINQQIERAVRTRRPDPGRLGLDHGHRRARPAAGDRLVARRPRPPGRARRLRALDGPAS